MEYFTHEELSKDFNYLMEKIKIRLQYAPKNEILGVLLQLTLGLSEEEFYWLTWGDIYTLDSDNVVKIRKKLEIRGFDIYIPEVLHPILYQYYLDCSYPDPYEVLMVDLPSVDLRIQYGKKVFEVYGYSDEIVKDLKVQFKIRQNSDLFDFLGYKEKNEINYSLANLDLDLNVEPIAKLTDKNFNGDYPFQTFKSFSKFLMEHKVNYANKLESSIRIILLFSLYTGVRMSRFLKLNWDDILIFNSENLTVTIKNEMNLSGIKFMIPQHLKRMILFHFESILVDDYLSDSEESKYLDINDGFIDIIMVDEKKDLFFQVKAFPEIYLNSSIFTLNNGNRITQPSLSREMKNALESIGFKHCELIKTSSTLIMWGRRIIELRGDHKPTIQELKRHFGFKAEKDLAEYLYLISSQKIEYKEKKYKNRFDAILYGVQF